MKNLLLLGKNVEVVRLKLADDTQTLTDELGRLWLDICFDDRALLVDKTIHHDNQFATLKALLATNFQVLVSGEDLAPETWYEISVQGQAKTIRPSSSRNVFTEPEFYPDWLVLDKSVRLSQDDQTRLLDFVIGSTTVKLATINSWSPKLLKQADLAFFERPEADLKTIKTLVQRTQLAAGQMAVVVTKNKCFVADGERIARVDRLPDFPVAEIYNCLLKLADYNLDAEDQAKLLVYLMAEISAGRTINWSTLITQLDNSPPVKIVVGEANQIKYLQQFVDQLTASGQSWIDLTQVFDLSPDEYRQLIKNLLKTRDLTQFSGAVLVGNEISATDLRGIQNLIIGVSCHTGYDQMPGFENELITAGLDGLEKRLIDYRQAGARLALWPIRYNLSETTPHDASILSNSHIATRFAKLAQEKGLLPVVQLIIQGCDDNKFNRIIKSLVAEMGLFKVDYANLSVLVVAPDCQSLSTQNLRDQKILVARQDQKTSDGEITSWAQRFKLLYDLPNNTEEEAQKVRTKFADILRNIDK